MLPSFSVPTLTVVKPVNVLAPDKLSVPTPALVKVTPVPAIIPAIEPVPLLLIEIASLAVKLIAAALNCAVVIVSPVRGVPPTAPVNVVLPVVLVVNANAPDTVELKIRLPAAVLVSAASAPSMTAPV